MPAMLARSIYCLRQPKSCSWPDFLYVTALRLPVISIPIDISYGIYLWNCPIIVILLATGFSGLPFGFLLTMAGGLTAVTGFLSAITIERYGLRLSRVGSRLLDTRSFAPTAVTQGEMT
jgi:peptidoglycan/LPS O-acetylase OafA/YrhL